MSIEGTGSKETHITQHVRRTNCKMAYHDPQMLVFIPLCNPFPFKCGWVGPVIFLLINKICQR